MQKIKKGDQIEVVKGRDSGKKGKVMIVIPDKKRAIVEGINMVKKHSRRTRQDQQGGIISIEAPISLSNLSLLCKNCNRPVRTGFLLLKDGTKSRICKVCKQAI
ncbi:MAG: 50S ribosomal protein L24 [Candidatus Omnitrophica bacterium]|nr:50S ribosomal protein L24 [Candidatus Omnitrophota bacterium]